MARICCSPPESVPVAWWARSLRMGKRRPDVLEVPAHPPPSRRWIGPQFQVGGDAQGAEDPAAFGHQGQTQGDDALRGHVGEVMAGEIDGSLPGRQQSRNGAQGGGLAGAVAADQGHHLTLAHVERDALEHRQAAIPGLDAS